MLAVSSDKGLLPGREYKREPEMFTYYSAKAHQDQLLREAEQDRLIRTAKRAKREAGKHQHSQAKSWSRRFHTTHA